MPSFYEIYLFVCGAIFGGIIGRIIGRLDGAKIESRTGIVELRKKP